MKLSLSKKLLILSFIAFLNPLFADTKHTIVKGDTLYSISKKYGVSLADLRKANNLTDSDVIKIGQTLTIPSKDSGKADSSNAPANTDTRKVETYTVVKGDTLYGIAKRNNIAIADLLALNNMTSSSIIKVGQKIKIYSGTPSVSNTTTTTTTKTDTKSDSKTNTSTTTTTTTTTTTVPDTRNYGTSVVADSSVIWPVKNPTVTYLKGKVTGVQLSAKKDETVSCIREGTVVYIGVYRGYGQFIFVQSKTGVIYAYAGLGKILVKKGDYVVSGTDLGTAGVDSITGKSQITFMVFQNGQPIDPKKAPRN